MDIQTFIQNFREAFGKNAELPLVFWYSDEQKGETEKINGCFFKGMRMIMSLLHVAAAVSRYS